MNRWQKILSIIVACLTISSIAIGATTKYINLLIETKLAGVEAKIDVANAHLEDVINRMNRNGIK